MTKPFSFAHEIIFPCYNIILMKIDEEMLFKIFLESTNRFDYNFNIVINGISRCCDDAEYHNGYIVFPLWDVPEDENPDYPITIDFHISLIDKVHGFNRKINPHYNEIILIDETWKCDKREESFVLEDTTFSYDTRCEIMNIHLENPPEEDDNIKKLPDGEYDEIIDVESHDIDKMIDMK